MMSTPLRFRALFGDIAEGDWVRFVLDDHGSSPVAWELRADDGYRIGRRRSLATMDRLGGAGPETSKSKGFDRALTLTLARASAWASNSRSSVAVADFARRFLKRGSFEIVVLDVGQASAVLLKRDGEPIGYFDAGAPIWFNNGSLPKAFRPPTVKDGFVFLSHWDFDHFDLGRRHAELRSLSWFAPNQPVGPNAARFQGDLGANLTFVDGKTSCGPFRLERGSGKSHDRNGTGYQLRFEDGQSAILLTGDTNYNLIEPSMKASLTGVTIPHHGGKGTPPPPGHGSAKAVVSYGQPNSYRHPNKDTLAAHESAKWLVARTARYGGLRRGDRILFP
jgi:hypothetical protein